MTCTAASRRSSITRAGTAARSGAPKMPEPLPADPCKTLAEALAALQARLPRAAKTADAQYGKYADLTMVSDALLPVMSELGLSFTARPTLSSQGRLLLLYSLLHV